MIEIPVTNDAEQKFSITIDGVRYRLRISFNTTMGIWTLDLETGGAPLVNGVVLVGGVNLLQQYNFPLKNLYAVNVESPNGNIDADADTLGTSVRLIVLEDGDLDA